MKRRTFLQASILAQAALALARPDIAEAADRKS